MPGVGFPSVLVGTVGALRWGSMPSTRCTEVGIEGVAPATPLPRFSHRAPCTDTCGMTTDPAARYSPAAERNAEPILDELQRLLPPRGVALEIAAGTGQHAAHFAAALPDWQWWPTDSDASALASIAAWCEGLHNVQPPQKLDVTVDAWPILADPVDLVYSANLLHIAPWPVCAALMEGAVQQLGPNGVLVLYGPFIVEGEPLAASNQAFDADLKMRDASWGLRRLGDVVGEAVRAGLALRERKALPANNLLLVFSRPLSGDAPSSVPASGVR